MAYAAGFGAVDERLAHAQWWWLAPLFGAVLLAFGGYYFAYRGIAEVEEGPQIERGSLLAVVIAAFAGVLAHGGTAIDELAMRRGGANQREARVRVTALGGFEHGILAMIVCPASVIAVVLGLSVPQANYTWPWAVIPPLGFAAAIWAAERYRMRLGGREGWRGRLGLAFDAIHLVWVSLRYPRRHGSAVIGMAVYWAADMFGLWAATTAFGFRMSPISAVVVLGTGMIFTRRTGPLAGAGYVCVALIASAWNAAMVPLAAATLGVMTYRFFTLWLPLPAALAVLPRLRALRGQEPEPGRVAVMFSRT